MIKTGVLIVVSALAAAIGGGADVRNTTAAAAVSENAAAGATVTISNFKFGPKVVRIKAGSEVTWMVQEGSHTVTADDGSFESAGLSQGQKFSHTFEKAGTFRYFCTLHGAKGGHDMAGTVIVTK
jgi:plastocyanin